MVAYSTTYSALQAVARQAVGLTAEDAGSDEQELIAQAPNEAVESVAQARRWPRLVKDLSMALSAGDDSYVLPADFSAFERDSVLAYSAGSAYGPLVERGYDEILVARAQVQTTGPPAVWAFGSASDAGGSEDGRVCLELWPQADADYTLVTSYRRQVRAMAESEDVPDVPLELHLAVRIATQLAARELFNQEIPTEWENRLERAIGRAWKILGPRLGSAPLRTLRRYVGVPEGKNRDLDASYPKLG